MAQPAPDKNEGQPQESVATRILSAFAAAVGEKGFKEVAERLQDIVVEKRNLTEPAIREALFGKAP